MLLIDASENMVEQVRRKVAIHNLDDQSQIALAATNAPVLDVRLAAIAKLSDQSKLADLINDYLVSEAAFKRITDQKILATIAVSNDDLP